MTERRELGQGGRPTLKTISKITGLGVTTVSRALKDGPELSAETRALVQSIASDIGYRPNRAGVRLRTGRTLVVGLILDQSVTIAEFERRIILGVSSVLKKTDYHLVVTPVLDGADAMEPVRYMVENGAADGLIFTHTHPRDERVRYLLDRGFPFVSHGRTELDADHPFYDFDNERFIVESVERLVARGRQRLALVVPPDTLTCAGHMIEGFRKATDRAGVSAIAVDGVHLDSEPGDFRAAARAMATPPDAPDGIICGNETRCVALMAGLRDAGLVVGEDVDVIAKETSDLLNHLEPAIDSFREDLVFAGQEVARLLLRRIDGAPVRELQSIAEPQFHSRIMRQPPLKSVVS
ncbi:MAG: LacI family DNA-binding transcriptional regulator [Hyphomicrobiales bacterium]|nr:LacI family DNA-binding transcriptional regulator [Hyphomicrobiales bacterium]